MVQKELANFSIAPSPYPLPETYGLRQTIFQQVATSIIHSIKKPAPYTEVPDLTIFRHEVRYTLVACFFILAAIFFFKLYITRCLKQVSQKHKHKERGKIFQFINNVMKYFKIIGWIGEFILSGTQSNRLPAFGRNACSLALIIFTSLSIFTYNSVFPANVVVTPHTDLEDKNIRAIKMSYDWLGISLLTDLYLGKVAVISDDSFSTLQKMIVCKEAIDYSYDDLLLLSRIDPTHIEPAQQIIVSHNTSQKIYKKLNRAFTETRVMRGASKQWELKLIDINFFHMDKESRQKISECSNLRNTVEIVNERVIDINLAFYFSLIYVILTCLILGIAIFILEVACNYKKSRRSTQT